MKTDATRSMPSGNAARSSPAHPQGGRWLADLERAWLAVKSSSSVQLAAEKSPTPIHLADAHAPESPKTTAGKLDDASSKPDSTAGASDPVRSHPPKFASVACESDVEASESRAQQEVSTMIDRGLDRIAAAPSANAPMTPAIVESTSIESPALQPTALAPAPRLSTGPTSAPHDPSSCVDVPSDLDLLAQASTGRHPEAPNYGPRLMQVAGADELQVNLRDAALTSLQQLSVAQALFEHLGQSGASLRRVYVNGRRFEQTALRSDSSSEPKTATVRVDLLDAQLASKPDLNDKE